MYIMTLYRGKNPVLQLPAGPNTDRVKNEISKKTRKRVEDNGRGARSIGGSHWGVGRYAKLNCNVTDSGAASISSPLYATVKLISSVV